MKRPGTVIVALAVLIVGLVLLVWKQDLPSNSFFGMCLGEISSALMVGGVISILYKFFGEKEQREELRQIFNIHRSIEEAGLDEVLSATQRYDYTGFLKKNKHVSVVLNDGKRWVGNYSVALRERFSSEGTVTKFYIIDPDAKFIACLADKLGCNSDELKAKVKDTLNTIEREWRNSEKRGKVTVHFLSNFPTHSVFMGDSEAIVTFYQISSGRTNVPVFIARDVGRDLSFFRFLDNDVKQLIQESTVKFKP